MLHIHYADFKFPSDEPDDRRRLWSAKLCYRKYGIKALKIEDCEPFLAFGFVAAENASLSAEAEQYLGKLKTYLQ